MSSILKNKKIILGVTGSIAAYKSPLIVRELVKAGAIVHCVMTPSASEFVTATTLANVSKNSVIIEMFEKNLQDQAAWHIQIAHWADAMLIAPCSATTLARIANGLCNTALSCIAIALHKDAQLIVSPSMDSTMWHHPSTQRNLRRISEDGGLIIMPEEGELASGLTGEGRLPEIESIISALEDVFSDMEAHNANNPMVNPTKEINIQVEKKSETNDAAQTIEVEIIKSREDSPEKIQQKLYEALEMPINTLDDAVAKTEWDTELDFTKLKNKIEANQKPQHSLTGKKVLISAGPTYEKIDDVRFIGNYSSGKMGFALARNAAKLGAEVVLVSGPVALDTPENVKRINVETADEMYDAVLNEFSSSNIAIMAAAVADFSPSQKYDGKIKKDSVGKQFSIELKNTKDILAELGRIKSKEQKVIGFALESTDEIENGWKKMKNKNADMIIVNSSNKPDSGFGTDNNTITILTPDGKEESFSAMSKDLCAQMILQKIV